MVPCPVAETVHRTLPPLNVKKRPSTDQSGRGRVTPNSACVYAFALFPTHSLASSAVDYNQSLRSGLEDRLRERRLGCGSGLRVDLISIHTR